MIIKRHGLFLTVIAAVLISALAVGCVRISADPDKSPAAADKTDAPATEDRTDAPATETATAKPKDTLEKKDVPEETAIEFEDPVFFELIKKELGKNEIYPEDLAQYTNVQLVGDEFVFLTGSSGEEKTIIHFYEDEFEYDGVRYKGYGTVKSLADLKYFTSLDKLYITLQPDIDYETIPDEIAEKVRILLIYQSRVTDIGFLDRFDRLILLTLNTNDITDLSPLEGKDRILWLSIDWNDVRDLTPLASMTALRSVSAYSNQISDLTPLAGLSNLGSIEFYNNKIKDISPLRDIKSLTYVELIDNLIEDVSPLAEFEYFDALRLSGNPIVNIELLSHIENLEF